jgi:hypothetical protein
MKYLKLMAIGCLTMIPMGILAQNPFGYDPNDTTSTRDIYGYDSRKEAKTYDYLGYTSGVMTRMNKGDFEGSNGYSYTLEEKLKKAFEVDKVDPNLRFRNQPTLGSCTGFLIAPNIMVTAAHCISGNPHEIQDGKVIWHKTWDGSKAVMTYNDKFWAVDYTNDISMTKKYKEGVGNYYVTQIPTSKQYGVKKVLISVYDTKRRLDYAVILLDRETDRDPFRFRTGAKIAKGDNLAMIGAPAGLPLKLADGAKVTLNSANTWFGTNLDAFGGNSGGPVYNTAGLNMIEGILVRGRIDKGRKGYRLDSTCGCVMEVKYDNEDAESVLDDYGYAVETMSTEVQRITSLPLSIKALAVYNNLEYALRKNNRSRYDKWKIYKWAYNNDTASFLRDATPGQDALGIVALKHGRTDMFKDMIDNGMKTELDLGGGKTMLYYAIKQGNLSAVKYILKEGYDLAKSDDENNTALHWAISQGAFDITKELLKNGADVNAKNRWGETPLHMAVTQRSMQTIEALIQKGADAKKTNSEGKTPRKTAKQIKFKDAARYLKKAEKGKL